ncbi:hypothetical protein Tco_1255032 [Tanacetum coccineum]
MYPFERCMINLKKKVQTRLNRVPRNDDGSHVGEKSKVNVFIHPCQPFGEATEKLLVENEYIVAERYVLLNYAEITPFVKEFDDLMIATNPCISDEELDHLLDLEFSKWVKIRKERSPVRVVSRLVKPQQDHIQLGTNIVQGYEVTLTMDGIYKDHEKPPSTKLKKLKRQSDGVAFEEEYHKELKGSLRSLLGFSTWMTFGGNIRDLGSFGEKTDKITTLHQKSGRIVHTERGDGVAIIKRWRQDLHRDGVRDLATASGRG